MPNSVERFNNRVDNYVRYRPGYPVEVINLLSSKANLLPSSIVADIGSGTGISARMFLENGNTVYGVEPNEIMRAAASKYLESFDRFQSIAGTAEATTLTSGSVDFVVAAQAFHWFDARRTRSEFKRVLAENGFVVLIWNERQLATTAFLRDYESLLIEFGSDYGAVRHENITKEKLRDFFQTDFDDSTFLNRQILDFDGIRGRMLSSSYIPVEGHPRYDEMVKKLRAIFAEHQETGKIEILYDTRVFYGQI
jgi:SAM-dependent methyltransferase